jgi:hypothetical protein
MLGNSRGAERVAASQEVLSYMELGYRNIYGEINIGMMPKRRKLFFSLKTEWRKCWNFMPHNMFILLF